MQKDDDTTATTCILPVDQSTISPTCVVVQDAQILVQDDIDDISCMTSKTATKSKPESSNAKPITKITTLDSRIHASTTIGNPAAMHDHHIINVPHPSMSNANHDVKSLGAPSRDRHADLPNDRSTADAMTTTLPQTNHHKAAKMAFKPASSNSPAKASSSRLPHIDAPKLPIPHISTRNVIAPDGTPKEEIDYDIYTLKDLFGVIYMLLAEHGHLDDRRAYYDDPHGEHWNAKMAFQKMEILQGILRLLKNLLEKYQVNNREKEREIERLKQHISKLEKQQIETLCRELNQQDSTKKV